MTPYLTRRICSILTVAALLGAVQLASAGGAAAQTAPAATPAAPAKAAPGDRIEARIKSLHTALGITADQETQWQAVADVMRENAKTMGALIEDRVAKAKTMSATDDLNSYAAITEAHAAGVKKLAGVFGTLYGTLSDAQKKKADAAFRHRLPSRPKKAT